MKFKNCHYSIWLVIWVFLLAGVLSCSGGGGGSGTSTSSGGDGTGGGTTTGNLSITLTDSPFSDAKAVLVTFSEVQVHRSGGGWVTVPFAEGNMSRTCDLKKLVGSQNLLGTGPLPAGHYTMIRLVVTQGALYFDNPAAGLACAPSIASPAGQNAPLEISSGEIKLNREFDLPAGGATTILVDFDGDRSIHQTGNDRYRMNPVISVVSVQ
jgi:hypothetical protein